MSFSNKLFVEPECDWEQGSADGTRNPADDGPTGFSIRDCNDSSSCGPSGISDVSEILSESLSSGRFFSKPLSDGFSVCSSSKLINCISSSSSSSSSSELSSKSSSMNGFF